MLCVPALLRHPLHLALGTHTEFRNAFGGKLQEGVLRLFLFENAFTQPLFYWQFCLRRELWVKSKIPSEFGRWVCR